MTGKRFEQVYGEMGLFRVKDNKTGKYYKAVLCGNPFTETDKPILDVLNEIAEENEQLQARNDRQAKRLTELYELMVKKDWESLTEIIDDFCSCEEQLQREWRTYE